MLLTRLGASLLAALLSSPLLAATTAADRLIEAVRDGDAALVADLVRQRADVNSAKADGTTALHWAAYLNDAATAATLIKAGARVDAATDNGVTPLILSCGHQTTDLTGVLLRAGADSNRATRVGETALMACARSGNAAGTRALLDHRADPAAVDGWQGQTALMTAVASGHLEAARVLVEAGADVNAHSKAGFTPLLFAAREGDIALATLLRDAGADVNAAAKDGSAPLLVAVVRGHVDLARWLLVQGADANASGTGYTALHWIAGSWHTELTGPNGIQVERDEQWVAMGGLGRAQKLPMVEALLAKGADPNARMTRNPPQFGYSSGRFKVGMNGATPFLLAAMDGNPALMKRLVAAGADPSLSTKEGTTPLMVASGIGRVPAESLVTEADTLAAVTLALEFGGDPKAVNKEGNTALHGAAHIRQDPLIQLLVDKGADVNAKNARGLTPLMVAEGSGHSDNPGLVGGPTAILLKKLGGQ